MSGLRTMVALDRSIQSSAALFADPMPQPPKWARDRVDEICGGRDIADDMPMVAYLRLASYVEQAERASREAGL